MTVSRIHFFFSVAITATSLVALAGCSGGHDGSGTAVSEIDKTEPCTHLPFCKEGDEVASSFDPCIESKTCYPVEECGYRLYCHASK